MNEIKQALKDEDWDLVIKLANKTKEESQTQKIKDALANPAKISVVTEGRNGQIVTYSFPIEQNEVAKIDYQYDRDYDIDDVFDSRYIMDARRRVKINISIDPLGDIVW